jgi:organic hydroperoxide reductase OsmC/OhrA
VLENVEGKYRFTEVILHPHVTVKSQEDIERAREIMESAHKSCLVTNSISSAVKIFPDIRVAPAA